jgi:hypothetical protein
MGFLYLHIYIYIYIYIQVYSVLTVSIIWCITIVEIILVFSCVYTYDMYMPY